MLLDDIRTFIKSSAVGWATLGEICDGLPDVPNVEIYALLSNTKYFKRVNNHYRGL